MAEMSFGGAETVVEPKSYESYSYRLKVSFSDEETEDGKHRIVSLGFASLLSDVDPDDIDLDILSKRHRTQVKYEGMSLVPHSRRDVTMGLVEVALEQLEEQTDIGGDVTNIINIEVEEKTIIKATPYAHQDYDS